MLVRRGLLASAIGGAALIALIGWFGTREIGSEVLKGSWSIPAIVVLHIGQLLLSALAWRLAVGDLRLGFLTFFRLRMIREGGNSLLPVAQIGGRIVCVRF